MSDDQSQNLGKLREAVAALGERLQELNARRGALLVERNRVAGLPLSKRTVQAELAGWLAAERAGFLAELQPQVANLAGHPDRPIPLKSKATFLDFISAGCDRGRSIPQNLVGLLADHVGAAVRAAVEEMDWPAESLTREERAQRLAELDSDLRAVGRELTTLQDALAGFGIVRQPILPTEQQIKEHFGGGLPSGGDMFDRGMAELYRRLNPGWT
ncbi:MAG: hypothetical protein RKO66_14270 [Candidatus Contendobacter sp.]|nr:hypothetical protein [Candidatus Contendobacter sp.]